MYEQRVTHSGLIVVYSSGKLSTQRSSLLEKSGSEGHFM